MLEGLVNFFTGGLLDSIASSIAETLAGWLSMLTNWLSTTLVTTIMYPEITLDGTSGTTYSTLFSNIYNIFLGAGIALIVLKVAYKAFQTYALGDNDPSADPVTLLKKMFQAFIVAIGFNSILYYILYSFTALIIRGVNTMISLTYNDALQQVASSSDFIDLITDFLSSVIGFAGTGIFSSTIFIVLWLISALIMYIKFVMRSVEMLYLRLGFPIACVGIIDSDYGVFKPYIKKFFQAALSTIIQISLFNLSISIVILPALSQNLEYSWTQTIFACCFLWSAFSVPKILQEFLLWSGGGSGAASTINMGANFVRTVRSFIK